jgi:hypothetical protein
MKREERGHELQEHLNNTATFTCRVSAIDLLSLSSHTTHVLYKQEEMLHSTHFDSSTHSWKTPHTTLKTHPSGPQRQSRLFEEALRGLHV